MQRSRPVIEFVNHASFVIDFEGSKIINDPWLFGTAFNDGWSLLCDSVFDLERFREIDCIWISHEHPDHFSPSVLRSVPEAIRRNITVLFQQTADGKVLDFCAELGYRTRSLPHMEPVTLDNGVKVVCGRVPLYDSWILYDCAGFKVLNINDCAVTPRVLKAIRRVVGRPDVLFTQFSYAGWKGGPDDEPMRRAAAAAKLRAMQAQIRVLAPTWTAPFASFSYFSHHENRHSNDSINRPGRAADAIRVAGSEPVVMYPGDTWRAGDPWNSDAALQRYSGHYDFASKRYLSSESTDETTLIEAGRAYAARIRSRNSGALLRLIRMMPLLGLLRSVTIEAHDLGRRYRLSLEHGLEPLGAPGSPDTPASPDVRMHSSSLEYLLRHDWGYDTLAVNGRFEADLDGFKKMKKTLSIGSLNNAGHRLTVGLLFDRDFLRMVRAAALRLSRLGA
ncbi:MAG: MBL fold metallo-hydrolase [Acidimicrobiaceae bacterium]|nr:MBL fold metallo-hydrolase [Acidimicrobiaceae bacterium]MCY4293890.1 MBL fold metallo-hydrolase [Acidimicrobiaceae bacterium]